MSNPCRNCPLPSQIDGLCLDCHWLLEISPRLALRQALLEEQSANESALARLVSSHRLEGRRLSVYRSVLHRCSCGLATATWLELHLHLQASQGGGHRYIIKGEPAPPRPTRQQKEPEARELVDEVAI